MELRFAITTVIEIAFVVAFLYALWHEGKIIAFEERMEDAVAQWLAKKIINRRRRAAVDRRRQNEKVRQTQNQSPKGIGREFDNRR